MAWTPRQPRIDYSAADAVRELSTLMLTMAFQQEEKQKERMHEKALLYEGAKIDEYSEAKKQLNLLKTSAREKGILFSTLDRLDPAQRTAGGDSIPKDDIDRLNTQIEDINKLASEIGTDLSWFNRGEIVGLDVDVDKSGTIEPAEIETWVGKQQVKRGDLNWQPPAAFGLGLAKYQYDPMKMAEFRALKQIEQARDIELGWLPKEKQQQYDLIEQQYKTGEITITTAEEKYEDLKTTTLMNKLIYKNMPEKLRLELAGIVQDQTLKGIEINIADALQQVTIDTGEESYQQLLSQGLILDEQVKAAEHEVIRGGLTTALMQIEINKAGWEFDEEKAASLRENADAIGAGSNRAQSSLGDVMMGTLKVIEVETYKTKGPKAKVKSLNYYYSLGVTSDPRFQTEIDAIPGNTRYDLIGSDLRDMVTSLVSGSIDAEKIPIQSPRHNFLVKVNEVYTDIYQPVALIAWRDPETGEDTTIKDWVDVKVDEHIDLLKSKHRRIPKISQIKDKIIRDAIESEAMTNDDALRYQKYDQWVDTGIFDDLGQLDMVRNALIQQDQYFQLSDQINQRLLIASVKEESTPLSEEPLLETIDPILNTSVGMLMDVAKDVAEEEAKNKQFFNGEEIVFEAGYGYYVRTAGGDVVFRGKY